MVTFNIVRSDVAIAEPEDLGVAPNTDTQQDDLRLQVQPTSPAGQFPSPPRPLKMYNKDTSDMVAAFSLLKGPNICSPADNGDESDGTVTLYLPSDYASFGHSVVSGDFDGDGGADLAVGSPHVTLDPMVPSQGSVFVVRGQCLFSGDRLSPCEGSKSTPEAQFKDPTDVRLLASRVLHGDPLQPQSRFGWSMAVVDLNQDGIDDLAIGAPGHGAIDLTYTGSVFVYFGHSGTGLSMEPDVTIYLNKTTTTMTAGTKDRKDTLAGLGFSLRGMDLTGTGYRDLVISMPMASVAAENGSIRRQAGRVLAFLAQSRHLGYTLDTDRDWELQGDKAFDWFDDWPRRGYSGKVLQDSLYGSQPMAHLSAAMQVSSDAKRLWLTEPFSSSEKGRILEWEPNFGGQSDDKPFSDKIKQCFTGVDTRTRFGTQLLLADLNGDGVDEVVVTSAHDSRFSTMAGTITIKTTKTY
ncbi:Glycosylphosphatidylinositol specific phospholipase D1 [Mortierella antarctica]|nr:Glycosylphosphatidylinositol specific phospholipase D1 [Mortierella antarctica]